MKGSQKGGFQGAKGLGSMGCSRPAKSNEGAAR